MSAATIWSVTAPTRWIEEGGSQPYSLCRDLACTVYDELNLRTNLPQPRVAATRYGAILLTYRLGDKELEIEIDNERDVTGLIATENDVLTSRELKGPDDWLALANEALQGAG